MNLFHHKPSPKKPITYRFLTLLVGANLSLIAFADIQDGSKELTLANAVSHTLNQHPELKAILAQQQVWEGRIRQAGVVDRPQVSLMIEDALGTGEHSALKSMQTTLTYSWLIQQEQIDRRISAAKSEAAQLTLHKQIKALDLSALVAGYFIDVLVKEERLKLNQLAASQAQELVDAIARRVNVGKNSVVEMHLARAELIRRQLAVEDVEHEVKASLYQLGAMWGKPEISYQLGGDLLDIPQVPSVDSQLALLQQNPQLQQFASAQRIAQSKIELARIEAKPQWQFTTGLRRYEASDDFGLVAGVSIPWGSNNRNAGTIASLQAQQDVLVNEQRALSQVMNAQLYVLLQEMAHSQHVIETVQKDILPTLEGALSEARKAFDGGQLSYTQYSNVRRELLSAQNQLLDAYRSLHLQHNEIQRLTGTSISQ